MPLSGTLFACVFKSLSFSDLTLETLSQRMAWRLVGSSEEGEKDSLYRRGDKESFPEREILCALSKT